MFIYEILEIQPIELLRVKLPGSDNQPKLQTRGKTAKIIIKIKQLKI